MRNEHSIAVAAKTQTDVEIFNNSFVGRSGLSVRVAMAIADRRDAAKMYNEARHLRSPHAQYDSIVDGVIDQILHCTPPYDDEAGMHPRAVY